MAKITTVLFGDLALLEFQPEAPASESLEFLTDILESYNGLEQRLQLRSKPRQMISYTVPLHSWDIAQSFNTSYGAIGKKWAVPIWSENQYVGTILSSAASITCNTTLYDIRASSLALLYANENSWQIVEIGTITGTSVNVTNTLSYMTNCYLIPIRLGWIEGQISGNTNGHSKKITISFEIEDNLEIIPAAPTQYLSNDIYYTPSLLQNGSLTRSIQDNMQKMDGDLGIVRRQFPWKNARYGSGYNTITINRTEYIDYKNFIHRRAGKFRSFWMPTFEQNLRIVSTGTITTTIIIEADSFNSYTFRPNIAILANGVWYPRVVSNPVSQPANRLQLTLNSALNVDASKITTACYLGLNRLNTDKIEMQWAEGIMESSINILELTP
jgi:hypothetical protein